MLIVLSISSGPLKAQLVSALCEEMGAGHSCVVAQRSMMALARLSVWMFLEEDHSHELATKFNDEQFMLKLGYLSDVFGKRSDLNIQLQGSNKHIPHLADRRLERGNNFNFEKLIEFVESEFVI